MESNPYMQVGLIGYGGGSGTCAATPACSVKSLSRRDISGAGAGVHIVGRSKAALAVGGSLAGLGSIVALFCGVWLSG